MTAMFLKHFLIRLRSAVVRPTAMFMLLIAGWSSLLLWPWFLKPSLPYAPAGVDLFIHLIFIFVWPMMVAFGTSGAAVQGGPKAAVGVHALPALPIGRRSRALAEALAALLAAVVLRMVSAELSLAWFGLREPVTGEALTWLEFASETATGTLLMLPGVLAWVCTTRPTRAFMIYPLIVAAVTFAALQLGLIAIPVVGPLFCLGLAALVLVLPDLEIDLGSRFSPPGLPRPSCYRPGLEPAVRLRRDQWLGSLRRWGPVMGAFVAATALVLVLDRQGWVAEDTGDLFYGVITGLSFSVFGMAMLFPMGIHLFQTDRVGGGGPMMSGGFLAAWSALPVRPVAVVRGVYVHAMVAGLAWILYIAGFIFASQLFGLRGMGILRFLLPLGLAVPAVAGFMTCTAVGDRVRGMIAFLAVLFALPAHIGNEMAFHWAGVTRGSTLPLVIDITVLALLGAIGGLPPLVHLRRNGQLDRASAARSQSRG